ncbi:intracellular protein transport protein USO1-like isoform X2 [Phalaenopsis equestris]|uniref:intracellular protein transport protein USO1-like isoform X2 n=1 Tax=Phalaenopsis equestris TaxID=78828 RepID=UPI0009E3A0A5|nr:intracellular protein transport protein USO1-like isoform X2 [Phalaenopsis equestris]
MPADFLPPNQSLLFFVESFALKALKSFLPYSSVAERICFEMETDWLDSSESRLNDKKYIKELEKELKNCSLEIGYLQDQLGLRSIEANCMSELVHSLELKLAGVGMLQGKPMLLTEKLVQSDDKCLQLTQEIKSKDEDFKNYAMRIEELEAAISSTALESQCEIESLRLEMIVLEERCFQAESLSQQMVQDKAKMYELWEEYEMQLHESQDTISFLEMENNRLKIELERSENKFKGLHCKIEEQLSNWFEEISRTNFSMHGEPHNSSSSGENEKPSSFSGICTCEEVLCPLVSKLALITAWDENMKDEMQKMAYEIQESELLVEKLKEELKEEKLKAKEDAEDLTQAMAELRYEITGMLQDECKRRASIEQSSLRRIQDLEEQKEQKKFLSVIRFLQEVHKVSETNCNEVQASEVRDDDFQHLREGSHQITNLEAAQAQKIVLPCCSGNGIPDNLLDYLTNSIMDHSDNRNRRLSNSASLEWKPSSSFLIDEIPK